ncbi:hypothetical protein FT641_19735 [Bacillus paranthracis]|uniref:hypothetical protein n=1 Tax=Bacillus paranthracis TaxID=2026186 RepID=UPI001879CE8B|nr:hypothetical protein [Bacillus paranthracis]MBE7114707.1 hypothetical protein [Bacillus paranthracis]MBE7154926.1 hypothetical protein [Bacillus paranthracis]
MSESTTYRLSKAVDRNTGTKVSMKIVGQYYQFTDDELKVGSNLNFRDVNETFGYKCEGEIVAVENQVIRNRDYVIVSTKIRDYYLLKYVRQGNQ